MTARRIDQLLEEYGASHQNKTNKVIHWICVPLIFLSVVGLIWSIPDLFVRNLLSPNAYNPFANWATVILVVVIAYYFTLSVSLGIGMGIFSTACLYIIRQVEVLNLIPVWQFALGIFVLALDWSILWS